MYSSDELPPVDVEELYLNAFKEALWPNPIISSAADVNSTITGPSGVKMTGPYSWVIFFKLNFSIFQVPPNYWLLGADLNQLGGAYGFLTEVNKKYCNSK
jgi:exo-1,4-beta-D-glucosaminidase